MMDTVSLEQKLENVFYPIARRMHLFFQEKPTAGQCVTWTRRFSGDILQILGLFLVAEHIRNKKKKTSLMLSYQLEDWLNLLLHLPKEMKSSALVDSIVSCLENFQNNAVEINGNEYSLLDAISTDSFASLSWSDEVCETILEGCLESLEPLGKFSLCWAKSASDIRKLEGFDSQSFVNYERRIDLKEGELALCSEDFILPLSPYFILLEEEYGTQVLLWDGKNPFYKKNLYHNISKHYTLEADERISVDSNVADYDTLYRYLNTFSYDYIGQKSRSNRYQALTFYPVDKFVAELGNFTRSKYANLAFLYGEKGIGKTSLICHLTREWNKKGHIVIPIEASEIGDMSKLPTQWGLELTWNKILKMTSEQEREFVLIITKIEEVEHELLLKRLQKFLSHTEFIHVLLVSDEELSIEKIGFEEEKIYRPVLMGNPNSQFIQLSSLKNEVISKVYEQYHKIPWRRVQNSFEDLGEPLQNLLSMGIWMHLLHGGCRDWTVPKNFHWDEIVLNYLDECVWEHPECNILLQRILEEPFAFSWKKSDCEAFSKKLHNTYSENALEECCRKGILEKKIEGRKEVVQFSLPILQDLLLAETLFQEKNFEDIQSKPRFVKVWLLIRIFSNYSVESFENRIVPGLLEDDEAIAKALFFIEGIFPTHAKDVESWNNKTAEICHFLLEQKKIQALLCFLEKIKSLENKEPFERLVEFFNVHQDMLEANHFAFLLEILSKYYKENDIEQAQEIGKTWFEATTGKQKRQAAKHMASIYQEIGEMKEANAMALEALEISKQKKRNSEIYEDLDFLVKMYTQMGEMQKAQELCSQMDELAQKMEDAPRVLNAWFRQAPILLRESDVMTVKACYDDIVDLINNQIGSPLDRIKALKEKGLLYKKWDQADEAIVLYQEALGSAKEVGSVSEAGAILCEIAALKLEEMEEETAMSMYQMAIQMAEKCDDLLLKGKIQQGLGAYYDDEGESEKAIELLLAAIKSYESIKEQKKLAETLAALGVIYDAEDKKNEALEIYKRAVDILQKQGNWKEAASNFKNIAVLYKDLGKKEKALENFDRAKQIFQKLELTNEAESVQEWIARIQ